MSYLLNIHGKLIDLSVPKVMGILNVTPDSFFTESRTSTQSSIESRVGRLLSEGADIIDIGGCSTRPGIVPTSEEEEMSRLRLALDVILKLAPDAVVSVDTFRSDVAKMCVEEYGVSIVNDVSGGDGDELMYSTVSRLGVPYVLTHCDWLNHLSGKPSSFNMDSLSLFFSDRIQRLRDLGQKDILLDPGFGFSKNIDANYALAAEIERLKLHDLPILIGISRKRMIYQLLDTTAEYALNGSTVLHTYFLLKGCANILRVHDIKACCEAIKIVSSIIRH